MQLDQSIRPGDNCHSDLLSSPEGPYLLFNIESLIQSQVLLLLCLKCTLKGFSLLVKTKPKQSPKQNAVTATPLIPCKTVLPKELNS